uniref:hypothetical protein n=1 Tax=Gelidibacter sp. TaxID=2018083 RepID=UPI004049B780
MKKIILNLAFCFIITTSFTQTTYVFDESGEISPNPFVTEMNGTNMELYNKTIKWIKLNFYNPDEVITAKIEGEFIRITGENELVEYTIEFEFKDNKYRTTLAKTSHADKKNGKTVLNSIQLLTPLGSNPTQELINLTKEVYQPVLDKTLRVLNSINHSLYDYLSGKTEKKDGW